MASRQAAFDGKPGSAPDIRTDVRGLTFVMRPLGIRGREHLVIRCDDAGEVWVSIQSDFASND